MSMQAAVLIEQAAAQTAATPAVSQSPLTVDHKSGPVRATAAP